MRPENTSEVIGPDSEVWYGLKLMSLDAFCEIGKRYCRSMADTRLRVSQQTFALETLPTSQDLRKTIDTLGI